MNPLALLIIGPVAAAAVFILTACALTSAKARYSTRTANRRRIPSPALRRHMARSVIKGP